MENKTKTAKKGGGMQAKKRLWAIGLGVVCKSGVVVWSGYVCGCGGGIPNRRGIIETDSVAEARYAR